jgi:hypothetical protein
MVLCDERWKMEDGRWKMEDGRWEMEDGRCPRWAIVTGLNVNSPVRLKLCFDGEVIEIILGPDACD